MGKYELIDDGKHFELLINGVPIKSVIEYKIEGTPDIKTLTFKVNVLSEDIKVQVDLKDKI